MAETGGDHVSIDVNDLLTSAYEYVEFEEDPVGMIISDKCCIFRVPNILYRHNKAAYDPYAFSIGPWHFNKSVHLKATQKIKATYLEDLIRRSPRPDEKLAELKEAVKEFKERAKECYGSPILVTEEDFEKILLLDGCFLIELFRKNAAGTFDYHKTDDPIFGMSCMNKFLSHDLILLENQIPWLVLERLFELTKDCVGDDANTGYLSLPLHTLVMFYFNTVFSCDGLPIEEMMKLDEKEEIKHIIDLLSKCLILPLRGEKNSNQRRPKPTAEKPTAEKGLLQEVDLVRELQRQPSYNIPSATRLKEHYGVGIYRVLKRRSILDLGFHFGSLEIPSFVVQDTTEAVFRNLIAYEQCLPNCPSIITSYVVVLHHLIGSVKDIDTLATCRIIDNRLDPKDTVVLFSRLYSDTFMRRFHYDSLCERLNHHCHGWWPTWRARCVVLLADPAKIGLAALYIAILQTIITVFTIERDK